MATHPWGVPLKWLLSASAILTLVCTYPQPSLLQRFFFLSLVLAIYLMDFCFTPPNQIPLRSPITSSRTSGSQSDRTTDRLDSSSLPLDRADFAATSWFLGLRRYSLYCIGFYHALVALMYVPQHTTSGLRQGSYKSLICPHPERLNPYIFTWSSHSKICLLAIFIAAPIRLLAYRQLGPNFTFRLSRPSGLVSSGLYAWVQHPSYTTIVVVATANLLLTERPDGVLSCWVPDHIGQSWLWTLGGSLLVSVGLIIMAARVRDEERMMKDRFGREWELWNKRTWRFIPFVF